MKNLIHSDLYQLILESTNEGIWVFDKNEQSIYANQKIAEMLAYTQNELVEKTFFEFTDPRFNQQSHFDLRAFENNVAVPLEYILLTKLGQKLWTEVIVKPISLNGQFSGYILFVSDISERIRTKEERNENLSYYYSLFEDSPIPIWDEDFSGIKEELDLLKDRGVTDPRIYFTEFPDEIVRVASKMIVNKINKAVVELNEGESKEDVLKNFKNLVTPKSLEYALHQIEAIWRGEQVCEFDAELKTLKDNYRYVHFKWTVAKGHEANFKRVFLTTTDLTERIKEENLNLQQANKEKAILLKEVHHRVKNNLQIISSLLKLQSYTTDDPRITEMIGISLSRISSMATVHELLYKSTEFSKINYHEYLNTLISSLISTMADVSLQIEHEIDVAALQFNIDTAIPLGLLINEIITNSLKHAFNNRTHGKIYVQIKHEEGINFVLRIGDNGIGSNSLISEKTDSLGMSLIRSLTDQLSGTIQQININSGTHYHINFKAAR